MKNTYLDEILKVTRASVTKKKKNYPLSSISYPSIDSASSGGFITALKRSIKLNKFAVIAEMKRASPSQGLIRETYDPAELARKYQNAQAACISVLTNESFFKGSLEHLSLVREAVDLPILRKDFIVDEYQIFESLHRGVHCILLIVAALSKNELKDFYHLALELGMDVLVEVHNKEEIEKALELSPKLIGINNRNLETFEVDLRVSIDLSKQIPADILTVSESGIKSPKDVKNLKSSGINAFLVGEAFMRAKDPGQELQELFFS